LLASGVTTTSYNTTIILVAGKNYRFKVQARNIVGFSVDSQYITIRASSVPDAPTNVVTTLDFSKQSILVSW